MQLVTRAERRGIGIDKYVTVGNQATTSALDVLDALVDDPETAAVLVYLEEVGDGRRFIDVLRRITPKKPVVVLPGGMTDYGRRAAASHTGAMAGSTDVFLAATRQTGCLVRTGPDESMDLALCLSALPLPKGRRVAIMTLGGGWGVLAADELARNDLELAELEPHVLVRARRAPAGLLVPQQPRRPCGGRWPGPRGQYAVDARRERGCGRRRRTGHTPQSVHRLDVRRPSVRWRTGRAWPRDASTPPRSRFSSA